MLLWFNFQGRIRSNFSTRRSKVRKKDSYFLVIIRNNAFHLTRAEVLNGSDYSQFCNLCPRSRLCLVLLQFVSKTIDNWQKVGSLSLLDWQWSAEKRAKNQMINIIMLSSASIRRKNAIFALQRTPQLEKYLDM